MVLPRKSAGLDVRVSVLAMSRSGKALSAKTCGFSTRNSPSRLAGGSWRICRGSCSLQVRKKTVRTPRRIVIDKGRGPQPHDRPLPCPAQGVQILPGIDQRNVRRFHDKPFLPNAGAPRRAEPVRPHRHRRHSAAWRFFDGPDAAPDARLPHARGSCAAAEKTGPSARRGRNRSSPCRSRTAG